MLTPSTTPGPWRKSSRSGGQNGTCVEARKNRLAVQIGDTTLRTAGEPLDLLELHPAVYGGFIASVKAGAFD